MRFGICRNFDLNRFFLFQLLHIHVRATDGFQFQFFGGVFDVFGQKIIESIFVEDAFTVAHFNDFTGGFAFTEAVNLEAILVLVVDLVHFFVEKIPCDLKRIDRAIVFM